MQKISHACPISLEEALRLLDIQNPSDEERQLERFRKWVERIVAARGRDYVLKNRRGLALQWEQYAKNEFKTCV